jgi:hypothetical protein
VTLAEWTMPRPSRLLENVNATREARAKIMGWGGEIFRFYMPTQTILPA